jgi:hypothetical protein
MVRLIRRHQHIFKLFLFDPCNPCNPCTARSTLGGLSFAYSQIEIETDSFATSVQGSKWLPLLPLHLLKIQSICLPRLSHDIVGDGNMCLIIVSSLYGVQENDGQLQQHRASSSRLHNTAATSLYLTQRVRETRLLRLVDASPVFTTVVIS